MVVVTCGGCLGDGKCWVCLGHGFLAVRGSDGEVECHRCLGSGRCPVCQPPGEEAGAEEKAAG